MYGAYGFRSHDIIGLTCETPLDSIYAQRGAASLTNNRRGDPTRDDTFEWRGVTGKDLCITVDMGKTVAVSRLMIGFLHQTGAGAFLPSRVDLALSDDGKVFTNAGHVTGQSLQTRTPTLREGLCDFFEERKSTLSACHRTESRPIAGMAQGGRDSFGPAGR